MSTQDDDLVAAPSDDEADGTATATAEADSEVEPKRKLDLAVEITDAGPCKKHLKVANRPRRGRAPVRGVAEVRQEGRGRPRLPPRPRPAQPRPEAVPQGGPGPGQEHAPAGHPRAARRRLQAQPDRPAQPGHRGDPDPDEGPLTFEMDVEVQPDFPLPAYKALTVQRPVRTIGDEDVEGQMRTFLERYAQLVPKFEGGRGGRRLRDGRPRLPQGRDRPEHRQGDPVPAPARAEVPGRQRSGPRRGARGRQARRPARGRRTWSARPPPTRPSAARRSA